MVHLTVNGKPVELDGETSLPGFLAGRKIDSRHVAVARNGDVIDRNEYAGVILRDGDVVEIVRMVGGG